MNTIVMSTVATSCRIIPAVALVKSLQEQVRLYSADPAALRNFYVKTLRFVDLNYYFDSEEGRVGAIQLSRYGGEDPTVDILIFPKQTVTPHGSSQAIPILFVSKRTIHRLWQRLDQRGVSVTPVRQDRSGLHFFEFLDPDHNRLEICQEP